MGWTCRISELRGLSAGNCWRKSLLTTGCGGQLSSLRQFLCFTINLLAPRFLYIGQAFRYSPENAFYIFNEQIYFII